MVNTKKKEVQATKAYTKQQILRSKQYIQKDVLNALLNDGKKYTHDQVQTILEEFLKKEAKQYGSGHMDDAK